MKGALVAQCPATTVPSSTLSAALSPSPTVKCQQATTPAVADPLYPSPPLNPAAAGVTQGHKGSPQHSTAGPPAMKGVSEIGMVTPNIHICCYIFPLHGGNKPTGFCNVGIQIIALYNEGFILFFTSIKLHISLNKQQVSNSHAGFINNFKDNPLIQCFFFKNLWHTVEAFQLTQPHRALTVLWQIMHLTA